MEYREVCTGGDLIIRGAALDPDRTAIAFPDDRRTYQQLLDRAVAAARSLHGLGVRAGDRVGVLMPNSLEYVEVWFGTLLLGAVLVPINSRFRSRELRHVVPDANVAVLVVADEPDVIAFTERVTHAFPALAEQAGAADGAPLSLEQAPDLRHVVDLTSTGATGFLPAKRFEAAGTDVAEATVEHEAARVALRDPATIFYTSGTTSLPKGCVLSHEAMVRQGQETAARMDFRAGDVLFSPLPMFHSACSQPLFAMLWAVGTYCNMQAFDAATGLRMIAEEQATVLYTAFPPITDGLVDHPDFDPEPFRRVRSVFTVAPPTQLRELEGKLPGTKVVTAFGMTEVAGSIAMADPRDPMERRMRPGRPLRGAEVEIRTIGDNRPAAPGVEGEIVCRGTTLFSHYHGLEEKTAEVMDDEGWFHTGDLGVITEDGLLEFHGRLKDMLKIGGENVAAIEIESHLIAHPDVLMAAVVGLPDDRLGEVAVAYLEVRPGAALAESDIIDWCRDEIASFKIPRHVAFVDEWPMSATKIRKVDLRDRAAEDFADQPPLY
ncbi:class I adenylate-forming enzyme family protein [Euzebya rosea]|uniref:class I adenylate-forming enzyme family protein n=1 Tax=Euzebya rosea TaxID=2052804 RepID=UPI0014759432|nr:class I adenylate-forming enzyme family protein [Euzebya rosea]